MTIRLTPQQKIRVRHIIDLAGIMQGILKREKKADKNKEHCWLVCLDAANRILAIELISLGSVNQTIIEPVEVFSFAFKKAAVKLILVHNHPGGSLLPSKQDIEIAERMNAIGNFVKLPIIDHLIISEDLHYSLVQGGKLKESANNSYSGLYSKALTEAMIFIK